MRPAKGARDCSQSRIITFRNHVMQVVGKCEERVNSCLRALSGAKPCIFSGKVSVVVAEGGSLFPQFRGSIGESVRQNAHRTVARAHQSSISHKIRKKLTGPEHFWKMRPAKGARDCSESRIITFRNHVMQVVGKCEERVNSCLRALSGAKPCIFSGKVSVVVAEGGSLFPQFRGSIGESVRQNAHRTVTRARLHIKSSKSDRAGALLEDEGLTSLAEP